MTLSRLRAWLRYAPRPSGWIPDVGDRVRYVNRWIDFHGAIVEVIRRGSWWQAKIALDRGGFGYAELYSLAPARWRHRAWTREILGARPVRRWLARRRPAKAAASVREVLSRKAAP